MLPFINGNVILSGFFKKITYGLNQKDNKGDEKRKNLLAPYYLLIHESFTFNENVWKLKLSSVILFGWFLQSNDPEVCIIIAPWWNPLDSYKLDLVLYDLFLWQISAFESLFERRSENIFLMKVWSNRKLKIFGDYPDIKLEVWKVKFVFICCIYISIVQVNIFSNFFKLVVNNVIHVHIVSDCIRDVQ